MTILTLQGLLPTYHGDVTRLVNSRYCVIALCVLAVYHVVLLSLFYPSPMMCICPSHFSAQNCATVTSICSSTRSTNRKLYLFDNEPFSTLDREMDTLQFPFYYYHMGLLLLVQAVLYYSPQLFWREMTRRCGITPDELSQAALEARRTKDSDEREAALDEIASHLQAFCRRQLHKRHVSYAFRWLHGNTVALVVFVTKAMYAACVIGQFFMLERFFGIPFYDYGWQLLGRTPAKMSDNINSPFNISSNEHMDLSEDNLISLAFPREVICDVPVAQLGNVHRYSLYCTLPLNDLNEPMMVCVWFLMCTVAVVTMVSLVGFLAKFVVFYCWSMNIHERLQDLQTIKLDDYHEKDKRQRMTIFEREFLHRDGLLLLEYIQAGGGDVLADSVLKSVWEYYQESWDDMEPMFSGARWKEDIIDDEELGRLEQGESGPVASAYSDEHLPIQTAGHGGFSGYGGYMAMQPMDVSGIGYLPDADDERSNRLKCDGGESPPDYESDDGTKV